MWFARELIAPLCRGETDVALTQWRAQELSSAGPSAIATQEIFVSPATLAHRKGLLFVQRTSRRRIFLSQAMISSNREFGILQEFKLRSWYPTALAVVYALKYCLGPRFPKNGSSFRKVQLNFKLSEIDPLAIQCLVPNSYLTVNYRKAELLNCLAPQSRSHSPAI